MSSVALAVAFGMGVAAASCTPATPAPSNDGTGGQVASTGSGGKASGSGGVVGTGGSVTGSGTGGSLGSTGSGGSPGSGGSTGTSSGGSPATGGTTGTATGGTTGTTATGGTTTAGTGGETATGGVTSTGSGGSPATGGMTGSGTGGSTTGSGGSTTGLGCNWVDDLVAKTSKFADPAPADKIVLFDGTTLTGWHKQNMPGTPIDWKLGTDGSLLVVPAGAQAVEVQTDMKFNDLCVHVEYLTPEPTTYRAANDVQDQGNSGVYLRSAYEMQILDTHDSAPLIDGCGAIYQQKAPYTTACYQHGTWNTYEIEFKGPVWTGTTQSTLPQFMKVALNGTVVQGIVPGQPNTKPWPVTANPTKAGVPDMPGMQPLGLQDHLDPVKFRNIWATIPKY